MRYIYSLLFYIALPYFFLRLLWRSRKTPAYRERLLERLGYVPYLFNQCIWIHAVSLGETNAAVPFIKAIKTKHPDLPILVTNMTPTGSARVKAVFGNTVNQAYIPYDVPDAVSRFLDRVNPIVCVIMETELWPNLIAECSTRNIPLMIANARLSEKSAKGYARIGSLTKTMLTSISKIAAQSTNDAERFIALGAPSETVVVTGNLKFDIEIPGDLMTKATALRTQLGNRPVWIAASTHPNEEEIILTAHKTVCDKINNALLILVPRHPERFDAIATMIKQQGFHLARRSQNEVCAPDTSVYFADTVGEMMLLYAASDIAFVGGSFVPVGGHNMLEPAVLSKPILTGPQLFNFTEISKLLLNAHGMQIVENVEQLASQVIELMENHELCQKMGKQAYHVVETNRGALEKQVKLALGLF